MLIALRKHTKLVFWIIILLIVPAFIVLYLPRQLRRTGRRARYGTIFGETVTVDRFLEARDAAYRAMNHFNTALNTLDYRKPQHEFLRARRDLYLALVASMEEYRGDTLPLEQARERLKEYFTDRQTGEYDESAYRQKLREVGMTDEAYVAEFRENMKVQYWYVYPLLLGQGEDGRQAQRKAAWMRLTLAHEAERLGIPVSDEEVLDYLYLICPGEDGTIDDELYARRLRDAGQARAGYENELRTTIRIAKLQRMILDAVKAPGQDVTERFNERYRTYKLAYHLEPCEPLMEPAALRDDEVLAFYARNRGRVEEFAIEPRVAVMYVLVETQAFESDVDVDDEQVRDYYEAHTKAFTDADGVPLPFEMCEKEVRAAVVRQEAEKLARAEATRLFLVPSPVRLIQEAARRGYEVHHTPLFGEEGPIDGVIADDEDGFRQAALGMAPGQVSGRAIKVAQGWCVLSPTQIVPDPKGVQHRPFDQVADIARTEAARAKARRLAHDVSVNLYERVEELMGDEEIGFLEACERLGVNVTETAFLNKEDEKLPGLEDARGLILRGSILEEVIEHQLAASDMAATNFYVFDVDEGAIFFHVLERRDPDANVQAEKGPEFTEEVVLRSLQALTYQEWYGELLERAAIVDLAEEQRRAMEQQQQQTPAGGLSQ